MASVDCLAYSRLVMGALSMDVPSAPRAAVRRATDRDLPAFVPWFPSFFLLRLLETKDHMAIHAIREYSQQHVSNLSSNSQIGTDVEFKTHPMLREQWYRNPLEYIDPEVFGINLHWNYYI